MASIFTVTCPLGAEEVLSLELRRLGMSRIKPSRGAVTVTGNLKDAYKACLWSRVASRVLWQVGRFEAMTADELYDGVRNIAWDTHIPATGTLWVDFKGRSKHIRNEQFGAQKAKDAIVDQLRDATDERPNIQKIEPDVRVHIRLHHGLVHVQVDLSGRPLHFRTPDKHVNDAPLKENLAATMLYLAEWPKRAKEGAPFVDPMCGSGTIALEAAGMANNQAPGLKRDFWGFTNWLGHQPDIWTQLVESAAKEEINSEALIYASDVDPYAVQAARRNAQILGFSNIHFKTADLFELDIPQVETGILLTNPPYGTRLGRIEELVPFYKSMGDFFKGHLDGWNAYIFCPANTLSKSVGLKTSRRVPLMNGALDCRLLHFQITGRKA